MSPRSLTPSQTHALTYLATRAEYIKLRKWCNVRGLDLPSLPDGTASIESKVSHGHSTEDVSRRALRLFGLVFSFTFLYENVLSKILRRQRLSKMIRSIQLLSSVRLASFIALFSTLYRLTLPRLRELLPSLAPPPPSSIFTSTSNRTNKSFQTRLLTTATSLRRKLLLSEALPAFLAGVLASPSMLLEARGQRRVAIAVYALVRALYGVINVAEERGWFSRAMSEGRWWWGGHLVFAAANSILLHSFVYDPSAFPPGYSSFILRYSTAYIPTRPSHLPSSAPWPTPRNVVDAIASASKLGYPAYVSPILHPDGARKLIPDLALGKVLPVLKETHPGQGRLTCAFLHPRETSCWNVFSDFTLAEFRSASKFFGALAVLGTLSRWRKFLHAPDYAIFRALLDTFRSSAFLSLALGTAWSTICLFSHYLPGSILPTKRFYIQGFLAGWWITLLNSKRQTDLGLYSARLGIQCAWDVLVARGKAKNRRNGELVYFALSMGALMAIFDRKPALIKSPVVLAVLRRIGGAEKVAQGVKAGERESTKAE